MSGTIKDSGARKSAFLVNTSARRRLAGALLLLCAVCSAKAVQTPSSYARLEQAAEMIRQGQLARAETEINGVLRTAPREASALNLLGVVRAQQQRTDEAEQLFLRALDSAPSLLGAYLNLGQLYLSGHKTERAIWAFTEASKLAPDKPAIYDNLAALYLERRDYESALAYLSKVPREAFTTDHLYLLVKCYLGMGRTGEALALVAPLKQPGVVPAEVASSFAVALAEGGLPDQAIEILEAARKQTPHSFDLLYNLGTSYWQKRDLARAEEFYTEALSLKPDDVGTLRALARVARARGDLEKALAHLLRARKIAPDSTPVLYDFGWTALNMNLLYDALPVLERLQRMQPEEPGYLYALAIARLNHGEGPRAQALINRYIELRPQDARGHYLLGVILYSLKQFSGARVSLERSLSLAHYTDAEYYLGMIAHNEGDEMKAVEWLQRALVSDETNAAAHTALGISYVRQKDYAKARPELERAIELAPKDTTAHYQLGIVYARLGEKERSQSMFALAEKLRQQQQQQEIIGFKLVDPPK
jgi:Flp pilus assembly protein TadD